tara:strand:+ start:10994 stop:11752 length:759 start_codon:yes stop_codon:yes gene_type:complete
MAWYDSVLDVFDEAEYESGDMVSDAGLGTKAIDAVTGAFKTGGEYDYGKILGAAGAGASLFGLFGDGGSSNRPVGYQGSIPTYTASRMQVPGTYDPNRRPGSSGQRYFTDVRFDGSDTSEQAAGLQALNRANPAAQNRQGQPLVPIITPQPAVQPAQQMAAGGIAQLKQGRFLDGATDGMADKKPAMIDNEQPAALSDGEFVIPADVVSHLGNGNSEAGAKVLEDMMARVRKERTGSEKQGKEIDPKDFLPA